MHSSPILVIISINERQTTEKCKNEISVNRFYLKYNFKDYLTFNFRKLLQNF